MLPPSQPVPTLYDVMTTVLTGNQIPNFRGKTLLYALRLECLGMKRRGRSAYSIVKEEYNLKGNKQSVYNQLVKILS
jgi:hypothetical protein